MGSEMCIRDSPNLVCLPKGLRVAAPINKTLTSGPKISEKSADLSLQVGKSGSTSSEENLNIVCMSNEPSGNKAMLGHVAPNLNLSVSESSLSFVNHPNLICLPEGLRAAAPITKTLTPGPKISENL